MTRPSYTAGAGSPNGRARPVQVENMATRVPRRCITEWAASTTLARCTDSAYCYGRHEVILALRRLVQAARVRDVVVARQSDGAESAAVRLDLLETNGSAQQPTNRSEIQRNIVHAPFRQQQFVIVAEALRQRVG